MSKEKRNETAIDIKMDEMAPVENMTEELSGMIPADQDEQEEDGSYTVEYKENELEYPDDNVKDTTEVGEYTPDDIQVLEAGRTGGSQKTSRYVYRNDFFERSPSPCL